MGRALGPSPAWGQGLYIILQAGPTYCRPGLKQI